MKISKFLLIAGLFFSLQTAFTSCSKDEDIISTENSTPGGDTTDNNDSGNDSSDNNSGDDNNDHGNETGEAKTSSFNSNESHNAGMNCMSCHTTGGPGEGMFLVAGTVYDQSLTTTMPKATVKLYSETNGGGTEVANIEVDALGNFYTTANIDFAKGLYPAVIGITGKVKYMASPITSGQCNSCHGSSMPITGE